MGPAKEDFKEDVKECFVGPISEEKLDEILDDYVVRKKDDPDNPFADCETEKIRRG